MNPKQARQDPSVSYRPVLCLPKTGSTSFTELLRASGEQARHEWDSLAVLDLGSSYFRQDVAQFRASWLSHRAKLLQGDWDVNTALYAVLAEVSPDRAKALGMDPLWLCRSPRPWLRSIVAWSMRFASDPYRHRWLLHHRGFVARRDPGLAQQMPLDPSGPEELLRYWLPVWLSFHELVIERGCLFRLTHQLPASHHANSSHFDRRLFDYLERLIPPFPALSGNLASDRICLEKCRSFCDQMYSGLGSKSGW